VDQEAQVAPVLRSEQAAQRLDREVARVPRHHSHVDEGAGHRRVRYRAVARILVVTNLYPPHHYGGYELQCRDVVEGLRARGHDVAVLTSDLRVAGVADDVGERDVDRGIRSYWRDHAVLRPPVRERLRIERANQAALARALDRRRPDVVSVWQMSGLSLGLLTTLVDRGVPLVYAVCDDWLVYGPRMDAWARLFLGRPRLGAAARRLTGVPTTLPDLGASGTFCWVTEAVRRANEAGSPWRFPDQAVVHGGVDTADFLPPPEDGPPRPWRWHLLYAGRIDPRKGIDTAVRALTHLPPEATLHVLGRGDERHLAGLLALVAQLGLDGRVRFSEAPRSQVAAHMRDADALVFPVLWPEPFGLVPLEAMAVGTPVVATGTGGSGEYLAHDGNCLLFPPGDAAALADRVEALAHDEALRARLVAGGLATAAQLTVDRLVDRFEALHLAVADRFTRGRPLPRSGGAEAQ
jgi:glycogen(starch) synthase